MAVQGQANQALRMRIALSMLRAFHCPEQFSADVVLIVHRWIDCGCDGPIPWPDNPFFSQWAAKQGLSEVRGSVGFKVDATEWRQSR